MRGMGYPVAMAVRQPAGRGGEEPSRPGVPTRAVVLLVEDEEEMVEVITRALSAEGYAVQSAPNLFRARGLVERSVPQLVILDRKLPDGDGAEFCRELRQKESTQAIPVLFLTQKKSVTDKVVGFKLGGDDYLTKPFAPEELLVRVEALLRRAQTGAGEEQVLRCGDLEVQLDSRKAYLRGKEVTLRPREFDLLCTLVRRRNKVLTRQYLLTAVWGYEAGLEISTKTVDVTIRRLREALGSFGDTIVAVLRYGYRFEPRDEK